ncbi:MAG TPA: hypothetical protein VN921_01425 [Chthoniobacterales bacterium]|nr:hypothetical protein [Chthoniobacterales bacterium]
MDAVQVVTPPHVKVTWRIALELALAIAAAVALWSYVSSRADMAAAKATQAADEKVIAQNDTVIKQNDLQLKLLAAQIEQIKADQARQQAANDARFARAQTPAQAASLTDVLLALKSGETKVGGTAAAPTLEVPKAELQAYEKKCEDCEIRFKSTADQLANVTKQLSDSEDSRRLGLIDLKTRTEERDKWKDTASGGSFWSRFKSKVVTILITGAATAAAVCISGHCK